MCLLPPGELKVFPFTHLPWARNICQRLCSTTTDPVDWIINRQRPYIACSTPNVETLITVPIAEFTIASINVVTSSESWPHPSLLAPSRKNSLSPMKLSRDPHKPTSRQLFNGNVDITYISRLGDALLPEPKLIITSTSFELWKHVRESIRHQDT